MSKTILLEPIVEECLLNKPETRNDNFLLYNEVLKHYIDTKLSLQWVFENHRLLEIPSLESITRCRRKLQERDPSLQSDERIAKARAKEKADMVDYALSDKQWY